MKRIDYDEICRLEYLYDAFHDNVKGKRHKSVVNQFEYELADNLQEMYDALKNRTYQHQPYYSFEVHEPKRREIFAAQYSDRVVNRWITDHAVLPVLSRHYIYDNAACQIDKGVHFGRGRLKHHFYKFYKASGNKGYVLKCDIAQFFPSINQVLLKEKLAREPFDSTTLALLYNMIDSFDNLGGRGLPLGNYSSQHFALYYLSFLDRFIKESLGFKHYVRYMDDFLILHEDKMKLSEALEQIRTFLAEELDLSLNGKTSIVAMREGVEYLGYRFYLTVTGKLVQKLKPQAKVRLKKHIKNRKRYFYNGKIDFEKLENILASHEGHLKSGQTYHFEKKLFGEEVFETLYEISDQSRISEQRI